MSHLEPAHFGGLCEEQHFCGACEGNIGVRLRAILTDPSASARAKKRARTRLDRLCNTDLFEHAICGLVACCSDEVEEAS